MSFKKRIQPNKAVCFLLALLLILFAVFFTVETYARHSASDTENESVGTAKWSVVMQQNSQPISASFDVALTADSSNPHVGANKFAPSAALQATFVLDLSGTEVAVDYNITADTRIFGNKIQSGDITLTVYDNGTPIVLGKETLIPLAGGEKFTAQNGVHTFRFVLTWATDGDNLSDVGFASENTAVSLPVSVKLRQHVEDIEDGKISSAISYAETVAAKIRQKQPSGYVFTQQDILNDNPERGFYGTSTMILTESGLGGDSAAIATKSDTSKLLHLKVDLSAFSGNMNGSGDIPLTAAAVSALEEVLENIKQNDNTVILRFVYDNHASGIDDPKVSAKNKVEPEQEMLLTHIAALGDTFKKYATTINVIQIGFYGLWGECYYKTDAPQNPTYYSQTVRALLNATSGTEITVAVRAPQYYAWSQGTDISSIDDVNRFPSSKDEAYRVGIFNDAYGANATDMGTYVNREKETKWLSYQSSHTFYGGEAITDPNAENGIGAYNNPTYFIDEAYKLHTSYLNWEWNQALHAQWAALTYSTGKGAVYNDSALAYIESRLGYRFVVGDVKTYPTVTSGSRLPVEITIRNTGFAELIKSKQSDIVIADSNGNTAAEFKNVSINAKDFISQTSVTKSINLTLPALRSGKYSVYLRISSGEILSGNGRYYSAIRFANDNLWNDGLQANYIAEFEVR